jgi:mitogen-activated protein kinase 15
LYPHASEDAIDLLKKLLHFNPNKRLSAEEAIAHPFVAQFRYKSQWRKWLQRSNRCSAPNLAEFFPDSRDPDDEPILTEAVTIPIDDNKKFSIADYRNKLYSDIKDKKREIKRRAKERKKKKDEAKAEKKAAKKKKQAKAAAAAASGALPTKDEGSDGEGSAEKKKKKKKKKEGQE